MPKHNTIALILGFFVMGYADMTGIAAHYVRETSVLGSRVAAYMPSMLFVWFLFLSLPASRLCRRFGSGKVVRLGLAATAASLLVGLAGKSTWALCVSFALLGMANTLLQVALPARMAFVCGSARLSSWLSLGHFAKAICAFSLPLLFAAAMRWTPSWRLALLPLAIAAAVVSLAARGGESDTPAQTPKAGIWRLLRRRSVVVALGAVFLSVGADVAWNMFLPQHMAAKFGSSPAQATLGCSVYFAGRMAGTFAGALLLRRMSAMAFARASVTLSLAAALAAFFAPTMPLFLACVLVASMGLANVFCPFSADMMNAARGDEEVVSALLVMAVSGGAIVSPFMAALPSRGAFAALLYCTAGIVWETRSVGSHGTPH